MHLKEFKLEAEALFSETVYGHGFLHYGYFPDGQPEEPSLIALGEAQQVYFDHMVSHIPEDVTRILDVGSGTGANAKALMARGYQLECLCPSEQLNRMARRKLPDVNVHTLSFEDFSSDARFDMCLFAESFHYIELRSALEQAARYADKYVLIFDYFRRRHREDRGDDTRGTHAAFLETVKEMGDFEVVSDVDETELIMPTFWILDHVKNARVRPFVERLRGDLKASSGVRPFIYEKVLSRLARRAVRPSNRHETFPQRHEYRLILLKKT